MDGSLRSLEGINYMMGIKHLGQCFTQSKLGTEGVCLREKDMSCLKDPRTLTLVLPHVISETYILELQSGLSPLEREPGGQLG